MVKARMAESQVEPVEIKQTRQNLVRAKNRISLSDSSRQYKNDLKRLIDIPQLYGVIYPEDSVEQESDADQRHNKETTERGAE